MTDTVFYLKDTGYSSSSLSGDKSDWLVNQGEPIRIHVTDIVVNEQANAVITAQVDDLYYTPIFVSRELPVITLKVYVVEDFAVNGVIYLYNKVTGEYDTYENPPVAAIVGLFNQMVGKQSHFDLYMSDGSGVTPDYFKKNVLYWLAKTHSYNSDELTPETHLNVKLLQYQITKASNKRYDITLRFVVIP